MTRAVCPGSFDPVTHGHLDIIRRTAGMVDEVVVAVGRNVAKNSLFSPEERVEMLTEACADWPGVRVTLFSGLLVDFCTANGIGVISKGLRGGDFDYELQMAQMNQRLAGVETIFLPTAAQWSYVSSSLVREIAGLDGDIAAFVPPAVGVRVQDRVAARKAANG